MHLFVYTSEHQEVKVALDPLVLKDVGAPLLVVGDWRVLPGQPSIHRRPGEFVCQCLQTSSHAPCHSCFGGSSGEDHFLVSDFTASHSVPEAAASAAALGPVPDDLAESVPSDGVDAHDFPEVSETPEVSGLGSSPGAGASGTSGASAGSGASDCEAGHAFASTLALSSSPPCHLSLLFLGPSVDSGGGRPSKRFRELLPTSVLCAYPGCSVLTPFNSVTGTPARCCGSAHERIFLRLDQCPSVVEGPLISISVYGPGLGAWAPIELLVSLDDMLVGAFAAYVLAVFLECSPLEESSFHRLWQIRLMPGARIVHDSDSYLLFPPASGHTIEWRSRDQGATVKRVGIRPHSVLSLTRLPLLASLPGADSDTDPLGSESAGGSSPDRAIIFGLCDCLPCSHPSIRSGVALAVLVLFADSDGPLSLCLLGLSSVYSGG